MNPYNFRLELQQRKCHVLPGAKCKRRIQVIMVKENALLLMKLLPVSYLLTIKIYRILGELVPAIKVEFVIWSTEIIEVRNAEGEDVVAHVGGNELTEEVVQLFGQGEGGDVFFEWVVVGWLVE